MEFRRAEVLKSVIGSFRLPFLVLTPVCLALGFSSAIYLHGTLDVKLACLVLLGGLLAHISANALNEFFDFSSGLDLVTNKTPFSGGSGSIPKCPQSKRLVLMVSLGALILTILIGGYLATLKGWSLWLIGFAGIALVILYTPVINRHPWLCLISPGLAFGPLFVFGAYLSVTEVTSISELSLLTVGIISLLPFLLVNNLLLLNQIPDIEADAQVGRVTFPVRYGPRKAIRVYLMGIGLASLSLVSGILAGLLPKECAVVLPVLLAGVGISLGLVSRGFSVPKILPLLGANVVMILAANILLSASMLIG